MAFLKKAINVITVSSLFVGSIFVSLQSPAIAGLTNMKLGDLNQSDWDAYCASRIRVSDGQIIATLADTHVKCQVKISESGSSKTEAESNASLSAERSGLEGSITSSNRADSGWQATFTSYQNSYHLNNWCRQKYSPNLYLFNPFTGENRIFVGDGGHACYKTVNK
ncbi:MAG: hypothetical protein AAF316_08550 [Cyanobacteria bacterium P01_A01_bin.80]